MKQFLMLSMGSKEAGQVYAGTRRVLFLKKCWETPGAVVFICERESRLVTGMFVSSTPEPGTPDQVYRHLGEISAMTKKEVLERFTGSGKIYAVTCMEYLQFNQGIELKHFGIDAQTPPAHFVYLDNSNGATSALDQPGGPGG